MSCLPFILLFVLCGVSSCLLAAIRWGRESLLAASLCASCLAVLAYRMDNLSGAAVCYAIALSAFLVAAVAGLWLSVSPLGPLVTLVSMGLYLRCWSAPESTCDLLLLMVVTVVALCLLNRKPGDAQIGAMAVGLGLLTLGLASEAGYIRFWRWGFDSACLALPALVVGAAGVFSSRDGEKLDLTVSLMVAMLVLAASGSRAELLLLLSAFAILYVFNASRKARAIQIVAMAAILIGSLVVIRHIDRIWDWFLAPADVYGTGFDLSVFKNALRAATPLGEGVPDAETLLTWESSIIYVLGQMVSSFGWAGLALAVLCVVSVFVTVLRTMPMLGMPEKNFALALLSLFSVSVAGNAVYVFHLMPIPAIPFPTLSSSASVMLSSVLASIELSRAVGSAANRVLYERIASGGSTWIDS